MNSQKQKDEAIDIILSHNIIIEVQRHLRSGDLEETECRQNLIALIKGFGYSHQAEKGLEEEKMEIKIDNLVLTSKYSSVSETLIIFTIDGVKMADVDSDDLKVAIEALEKSCWRP